MIRKIYTALDRIRSTIIVSILSMTILLCLVQIVLRYLTSADLKPFPWGDEIIRLSSVWVAFMAASIGVRQSSHLSVEFFLKKFLPEKIIVIVQKAANVVVLVILSALIYYGFSRVSANVNASLQNLPISMAWFYASIPVGSIYLFIDYLLILIYGRHPFATGAEADEALADSGNAA